MPAPTGQLEIVGVCSSTGPSPTGQLALAAPSSTSGPAPTQVLNIPALHGRNRRITSGRVALVGLAVIALVLGTVSLIGEPPALARSAEDSIASEPVEEPASPDGESDGTPSPDTDTDTDTETEPGENSGSEAPSEPADDPADALEDIVTTVDAEEPGDVLDEIAAEIEADTSVPAAPGAVASGDPGVVYLTFDDGPHPVNTPAVLDVLARHNAKGTFFVLGSLVEAHPQLFERIVAEGHTVANHTWAHEDLAQLSQQQFNESVGRTQAALGAHATACLRPPYGSMNENTRAWAAEFGLEVILWDTDTLDWQKPGVDVVAQSIIDGATNGRPNILLHDGGGDRTESVLALDRALTELSGHGLSFEPVCR